MEKEIFTPGSALRLPTQPGRPGRIIEAAVYALLAAFFAYASAAELCALATKLSEKAEEKNVWPLIGENYFAQAAEALGIPDYRRRQGVGRSGNWMREIEGKTSFEKII